MRQPTRSQQAGLVLLAIAAGLGIAELAVRGADGGAFPHVNFYVPDADLGVRLEPGATMKLQLGTNPITAIRVNEHGYRGEDWPSPSGDEILTVGDSQVFGLGVEEDETFSARLAGLTGQTVLNGGVPTYGPEEYVAVVAEVLAARPVTTVVFTVNMANDLFEVDRPNRERHGVWDGWATRTEAMPESQIGFPGRTWLFRHSHAVFAMRRLLWSGGPDLAAEGAPSEGTWIDLVATAEDVDAARAHAEEQAAENAADQVARVRVLEGEARDAAEAADQALVDAVVEADGDQFRANLAWEAARGNPGDIVGERGVEESRSVALTAGLIRKAAQHRKQVLVGLEGRSGEAAAAARAAVEQEQATGDALQQFQQSLPVETTLPSVLSPTLTALAELCRAHDAALTVLVLPLDIQVDPREWEKYGVPDPPDMSATNGLADDVVASAEALGLRAINGTAALAAAEPGAFLVGDLHMTARGHAAIAKALAARLAEPAPMATPRSGLPEGRTRMPAAAQWWQTTEATVKGSSRARCETVQIDEWLRITCVKKAGLVPAGVEVTDGGSLDTITLSTTDATTLLTPLTPGQDVAATFWWASHHQYLSVTWPTGAEGAPSMRLSERQTGGRAPAPTAAEARLCACHQEVYGERLCENHVPHEGEVSIGQLLFDTRRDDHFYAFVNSGSCTAQCTQALGVTDARCMDVGPDDCAGLLRCAMGEDDAPCPDGQARVGGTQRCLALCDVDRPCVTGTCERWQGAGVCVP
jgi:hypothetical protein